MQWMLHILLMWYVGENVVVGYNGYGGTGCTTPFALLRMNNIGLSQWYHIAAYCASNYLLLTILTFRRDSAVYPGVMLL